MSEAKEALRQQMLLRALWRDARPGVLAGWTRDGANFMRGLQTYQANAGALAERALAAAFPTLQELLGDDSFANLARAFWHHAPPERGDVGTWGCDLARFVATAPDLADEPYLTDVARLEWAVHQAQSAADSGLDANSLAVLTDHDPQRIWFRPKAGTQVLVSLHPVVGIWLAHRQPAETGIDRFAAVRQAFAAKQAQTALIWRGAWAVQVVALDPADALLTQALCQGQSLGRALEQVTMDHPGFEFEVWLVTALQRGWLAAASVSSPV